MNVKETRAWAIREELATGEIDSSTALVMARYAREQVLELYQGEANLIARIKDCTDPDSPEFSLHHINLLDYQRLGQLIRELEEALNKLPELKILVEAEELNRVIRQQDGTYQVVKSLPDVLDYLESSSATYTAEIVRKYLRKKNGLVFTDSTIEAEIKRAKAKSRE